MRGVRNHRRSDLFRDLAIVVISVVVAILLVENGALDGFLNQTEGFIYTTAFIAGFFFTSIFTISLSTVVLGNLMLSGPIFPIALVAAAGAVIGDFLIFQFMRDRISEDVEELVKTVSHHRVKKVHRLSLSRFLWPLLGALIIASPLPDELGLAILGMNHISNERFVPISYVFNFIGLVIVGLVARAIV